MKVNKGTIVLSSIATVCFFIAYFLEKETINFILGCAWICITIEEVVRIKKKK